MNKKISVIGIGMDGCQTLTEAGKHAIEAADILIGARRMTDTFNHLGKPSFRSYDTAEIARFAEKCEYANIAILVSGDVGFYSLTAKLLPLLDQFNTEVICGISSPVYFCSRINIPWQDVHFVSLHGMGGSVARQVRSHHRTFLLLGGKAEPSVICQTLCDYGIGDAKVYIGENLAMENEKISIGAASEFTHLQTGDLCVMLAENPDYERHIPSGIADGEFIRGSVPMTKAEVRALCVAKLAVRTNDICWDIGCGTGSVSVEMAFRCPNGTVFSVDKNPEAIALTVKNMCKFGCDNISPITSHALSAINFLCAPDCVFIGGSGGGIGEIIRTAVEKNPSCRIVATAVSLETLHECIVSFEKFGLDSEISQIAVTRTKKIGSHTMLSAENPIFIIERKLR